MLTTKDALQIIRAKAKYWIGQAAAWYKQYVIYLLDGRAGSDSLDRMLKDVERFESRGQYLKSIVRILSKRRIRKNGFLIIHVNDMVYGLLKRKRDSSENYKKVYPESDD